MPGRSFLRRRTPRVKPRPWYERGRGARSEHDRALVARFYPGLEFRIDDVRQKAILEGTITLVEEDCGVRTRIASRIEFPATYPKSEPEAFETGGRFERIPKRHIDPNGKCCLWLPPRSPWDPEDQDALRRFLDELAVFFHRQLVFDVTGTWPGREWDHGDNGYLEYLLEELGGDPALLDALTRAVPLSSGGRNAPCPCGSGRKYKRCHLNRVETLAHRLGSLRLQRLLALLPAHQRSRADSS